MSGSDPRRFGVADSSSLRVLWVLAPVLLVLGLSTYHQLRRPAGAAPWIEISATPPFFLMQGSAAWSIGVMLLIAALLAIAFFRRRVELDGSVLDVRSTLYRRRTPVADLLLDQAALVDLRKDRHYAVRFKTNGYSMPGFLSGHFRLQGGQKGFALVTDRTRVLALPVRGGSVLLLSMDRPQALLDALHKVAALSPPQ
ncbi:hypothetical protein [Stenotrophomonas sp. 24(2023)]|uniref:hypothetical protein n=1 Tax=Stenotrophomonas sp. 24(2023) TaxID=3068324 RepID=UPI0027E05246|nr:hypothetical protein [Stenotrophomonas sp. 24(2023)]WMJ68301.1 hypothetical protein Q9R17_13975 [Stenotrophomonas sp. 24(2023)]